MGILILIFLVALIVTHTWPYALLIGVVLLVRAGYRANREAAAERAAERAHERRLYEARLTQRIAGTQRELAQADAELGLGSAPLSAVNADSLERLAASAFKVN